MYQIIKDGETVAITEKLHFIKQDTSGIFKACNEREAQGIAVNNTPYNLIGREAMNGCETVAILEVDGGASIQTGEQQQTALAALLIEVKYKQTLYDLGVCENA